ncbi:MAG: hypothetical protein OXC53_05120, partial [Rhodobacteraceae bacterium]|nr:hypothetical protein [Paracoccaceae bacterium]
MTTTTVETNISSAGFVQTDLFGILDSASIERRELLRKHGASDRGPGGVPDQTLGLDPGGHRRG